MAVSLLKGDKVNLQSEVPSLKRITLGLGWGTTGVKSLLDRFKGALSGNSSNVDIDSFTFLLDSNHRIMPGGAVYFSYPASRDGSVRYAGDDRTGRDKKGAYDNEETYIDLARVPATVQTILFGAHIYQCTTTFDRVENAYIRVLNSENREVIARYELGKAFGGCYSMIIGALHRKGHDWEFEALGEGGIHGSISEIINQYK